MLDSNGLPIGAEQLLVRARDVPDGSPVYASREPSDPAIRAIQLELEARSRSRRVRVTVTVINQNEVSVQQLHFNDPQDDGVATAMNQPTGF